MEAVNRSRSNIDPLASVSATDDSDDQPHPHEQEHNMIPEVDVAPVDMYTNQFLSKIR
mgnify:FL=1